jgi:hypothetical protein
MEIMKRNPLFNFNLKVKSCWLVFFIAQLIWTTPSFSQAATGVYPVKYTLQIIPYGTDNSVSGPFIQMQYLSDKFNLELSYGVSYQDVFNLTVVNSNNVLGIKTYLRQTDANIFIVSSVTEKANGGSFSIKKIKGWRFGLQNLNSFYAKKFNAASQVLAPRGSTAGETYLYYPSYYVNTNFHYTFLHIGYNKQKVIWDAYRKKGRSRETYCNALITAPFMLQFEHVTQTGSPFTGVAEKSYKNLLGLCVGVRWISLSPLGAIFGCETGLRPGLCHYDATYGTGTDIGALGNFYFDFKLGFSLGLTNKKK